MLRARLARFRASALRADSNAKTGWLEKPAYLFRFEKNPGNNFYLKNNILSSAIEFAPMSERGPFGV